MGKRIGNLDVPDGSAPCGRIQWQLLLFVTALESTCYGAFRTWDPREIKQKKPRGNVGIHAAIKSVLALDDKVQVSLKRLFNRRVSYLFVNISLCIAVEIPHPLRGVFNAPVCLSEFDQSSDFIE